MDNINSALAGQPNTFRGPAGTWRPFPIHKDSISLELFIGLYHLCCLPAPRKVSCIEKKDELLCLCDFPVSPFSLTRGHYAIIQEMLLLLGFNPCDGGKGHHSYAVFTTGTWKSLLVFPIPNKALYTVFLVSMGSTNTCSNTSNTSVSRSSR